MTKSWRIMLLIGTTFLMTVMLVGCDTQQKEKITELNQLSGKEFGVPTGSVADKLVQSKFADAKFQYYNSVLDAAIAVKQGKIDAAAYDEPILKNIAAKNPGLQVLPEMLTHDDYGFAVRLEDVALKNAIDSGVKDLKENGDYDLMINRWLPEEGQPKLMPKIETG